MPRVNQWYNVRHTLLLINKIKHNKNIMKVTTEYDKNGNVTHYKTIGFEFWREFDKDGNCIHHKDSNGFEWWSEFDKDGNETYFKNSNGIEYRAEYDKNGKQTYYRNSNGIERGAPKNKTMKANATGQGNPKVKKHDTRYRIFYIDDSEGTFKSEYGGRIYPTKESAHENASPRTPYIVQRVYIKP